MRGNNKGLSLVELIVVILIIGIISGGAVIAISTVYNADVERAAKTLCIMMSEAREQALGEDTDGTGTIALKLVKDSNGNYISTIYRAVSGSPDEVLESKKIGNYKMNIFVGPKNSTVSSSDISLLVATGETPSVGASGTESIEYTFSKSTGGLEQAGAAGQSWYDIILDGSEQKKIIVVPVTGRCYVYE